MKMPNGPRKELEKARSQISSMTQDQSTEAIQEHWTSFLHALERVWSKSEAAFRKSPKWQPWSGRFVKQRKEDPLLSYLRNARGAEEHTLEDISTIQAGGYAFNPKTRGSSTYVDMIQIDASGNLTVVGDKSLSVTRINDKVIPTPIKNRGRTYNPPTSHLGRTIDQHDIVKMAEHAITYYSDFLDKAETHLS